MTRPVLRLATRINRRTRWTAWAIALACMVLVGSLSLIDGLGAGVNSVAARFSSGPTLYLRGTDLLTSAVDENSLVSIPSDYAVLRAHVSTLSANGITLSTVVASLTSYHDGNATDPFPAGSQDVAIDKGLAAEIESESGSPLGATVNVTLFGLSPESLAVALPPANRPTALPDTWAWIRSALFVAMSPSEGGPVQAVLTPAPLNPVLASQLGLSPLQTVGVIGFTQASIVEARSILLGIAVFLAAIMALLVSSAMGLEVSQRREEIATLRSLGASPATVAAVYEGKAASLALLGATLGSALGVVAAHAIVSFAPLVGFPNLILLQPPLLPVAIAYALALAAACVAGLEPTIRAIRLVRGAREVGPS